MKAKHTSLEQQLTHLYAQVPPPPGGLAAGKERLLIEAARLRESTPAASRDVRRMDAIRLQRRSNVKLTLAYRLIAAVLAIILGTTAIGGGTALVAADSLPGDVLYRVKLATEDFQLTLAADAATQAGLYLDFATERASEMAQLAQRGDGE
jgi:hypothetical protein